MFLSDKIISDIIMSIENSIKLLWDCATTLVADGQTHKLLKSYYMNTCRNLARNSLQIPKEKFAISQMCPHCGCFWSESEFSLRLKPQHVAKNARTSQLIENLDKSKDPANKNQLNKKQRNRAKWLKKRVGNYMEINCRQCKHKSFIKMEKPKKKLEIVKDKNMNSIQSSHVNVEENTAKTKKKRKPKSKTAGLKIPQIRVTDTKEHINKTKTEIASAEAILSQPHNKPANKNQHENPTSKLKSKKKRKAVASTTPSTSTKVISKTQKQNSLLHLAALLKNQSSTSDAKSSAQKRLESLLK